LAQLCLDPHYRTLEGICALLEKEWLSFGHKFKDRCGHLSKQTEKMTSSINPIKDYFGTFSGGMSKFFAQAKPNSLSSAESISQNSLQPKEISPVFVQFLDCLYQIWIQYPTCFEFDESLLLYLFFHCYSCEFGNFLFNNENETREFMYRKGNSFGSTIQESTCSIWQHILATKRFINPLYEPNLSVIVPNTSNLVYWSRAYHVSSNWKEDIKEHLDPRVPIGIPLYSEQKPVKRMSTGYDLAVLDMEQINTNIAVSPVHTPAPIHATSAAFTNFDSVPDPFSPSTTTDAIQIIPKQEFDPLSGLEVVDLQHDISKNPWA
jgi:hypothetical protein